ncbi:MAG: type II toxin-antitoxin system YhaV family toxin [Candidatus Dormibacteria bacterium]
MSSSRPWQIVLAPPFRRRYEALLQEAERLQASLPEAEYRRHPRVKLLAAMVRLIDDLVPADPNAPEFRLRGTLKKFRRAKGHGLPERYRLFWAFSESARTIIFLYLNDEASLRKAGAKTDPYVIFGRMVDRGELGDDFESNYRRWQKARTGRL